MEITLLDDNFDRSNTLPFLRIARRPYGFSSRGVKRPNAIFTSFVREILASFVRYPHAGEWRTQRKRLVTPVMQNR